MATTWQNITVDDYGYNCKLRVVKSGVAQDLSEYTSQQFIFRSPRGQVATKTAGFDTDGTDGVLRDTVADGDIDEIGEWQVQARVSTTSVELTTEALTFRVKKRIDG